MASGVTATAKVSSYKNDLRDTYPYGLFAAPMKDIVTMHASSGTTGKQIVAGYTENDLKIWGDICARQLAAVGCEKTDIVHTPLVALNPHR